MKRRRFSKMVTAGFFGTGLPPLVSAGTDDNTEKEKKSNINLNMGPRRELFLDDSIVAQLKGEARRVFHKPVPREVVMKYDKPWEKNNGSNITIFVDSGLYRMYYMAGGNISDNNKEVYPHTYVYCYAESPDGINWVRPNLGLVEFAGAKNNNIIIQEPEMHFYSFFKDSNPDSDTEALYKALGYVNGPNSYFFPVYSSDGINWIIDKDKNININGNFLSQNIVFWDERHEVYRMYYRQVRPDFGWDIRAATSPDFQTWDDKGFLNYKDRPSAEFYTSVIHPYQRAPHLFIGTPGMYHSRKQTFAYKQLAEPEDSQQGQGNIEHEVTALTDTWLMWTRDGITFEGSPGTFIPPGPERSGSWMTGNHLLSSYAVETPSKLEGFFPELSFYSFEFHRDDSVVKLRRYTCRLDGFASIHGPIEGGEVITMPLIFDRSRLSVNFATSASGSLRVEIQDVAGNPVPGFSLGECLDFYGDTADRYVKWIRGADLTVLAGKPVRLRFELFDAHLYAFKFTEPLSDIKEPDTGLIDNYLEQNYPNPFSSETTIKWHSNTGGHTKLEVFDTMGRKVKTLFDGYKQPGNHEYIFNLEKLMPGIYYYQLMIGDFRTAKGMIIMRH